MFRIRDHQTGDLFDPWAYLGPKRRDLLKRSWAGVFRDHLLNHLPIHEVAAEFDRSLGRPTKDLHVALGVLILQQIHDLSDAAAVESLAFNVAWQYALDVREESDAYLCEKTMRNYRRRVIVLGLDGVLFKVLTDELIQAFGVDTAKQRIDSTSIRSAMRTLTRLGIVVETANKFLRELARVHPRLSASVDSELRRKYVEREGAGCFGSATPSESHQRLPEAGRDLFDLWLQFRVSDAASLDSFRLLERVLHEQFEIPENCVSDGGNDRPIRVKEPSELPADNVQNPSDPDASYNGYRGQGYMAQIMESYQEDDDASDEPVASKPDLITHVAVHKMTVHDGDRLDPALDDVRQRQLTPDLLLGDSHYGSNENIREANDGGTELLCPSMSVRGSRMGRLTLEQFELNDQGLVRRCPAGHAPISTSAASAKLQARFDDAVCSACPLREACLTNRSIQRGEGARFQYTRERVNQRTRRLLDQSDEFKKRYRWRAGMEGTMSRLKHQLGLAKLRVRGLAAVTYRVVLRALGLNVLRCAPFQMA